jgi:hypothetical protein
VSAKPSHEGIDADVEADLLDPPHEQYTMIPNALLRNHDLSTDARAILGEWLTHVRTWRINLQQTAEDNHLPYERARKAVQQLRGHGYVHFIKRSGGRGKWEYKYRVASRPITPCKIDGCQDCAITPPKTGVCKSGEEPQVSGDACSETPGQFTHGFITQRKTGVITEDHLTEDHKEDAALRAGAAAADACEDGALFGAPAPPVKKAPREPTEAQLVNKRAQALARGYCEQVPLSKFLAVMGIAKRAVQVGTWPDEEIAGALADLARQQRPLTVDTLRIALEIRRAKAEADDGGIPPWERDRQEDDEYGVPPWQRRGANGYPVPDNPL